MRVQIEKLYRPLYFLSSQNETLFELVGRIRRAYGAEYSSKNWSPSEHTQANVKKDTEMTIQIANSYVAIARENSTAMVDILKSNYEHIDPEDEEVFRQFVLDQTRLKQEFPAEGPIKIPFRVYKHVGEISYMRPDFSDRVPRQIPSRRRRS